MADEKIELTYKRAFEMGYWLGRGKYEKLDQLIKSAEIHPEFQKGLVDGRKEADQEIIRLAFRAIRDKENKETDAAKESEEVDPVYKKGFEHGYWLKRGDSKDLDGVISGSKNHAPYHNGLKAGKKEAEREQVRQRLHENTNQSSQERDIDID